MFQALLFGLVMVGAALALRRLGPRFMGPVLFYDVIRAARRDRYVLLRIVYLTVLFIFLLLSYDQLHRFDDRHDLTPENASLLAELYFQRFIVIQLIVMSVLTPAYVAGCIAEEKERKTLEFMLATGLHSREIVLGKLGSRLANLFLLVIAGLPILGILQFLGGVDPGLMLAGFVVTLLTVLGLASFGMLCSVLCKKPRDAIVLAYLGSITYILIGFVLAALRMRFVTFFADPSIGAVADAAVTWFNAGNLLVAFVTYANTLGSGLGGSQALIWELTIRFAIFHVSLFAICLGISLYSLRRVALKENSVPATKATTLSPGRPGVGILPILWREVYVEGRRRAHLGVRVCAAVLVIASFGIGFWILVAEARTIETLVTEDFAQILNGWVRTVTGLVSMLMLLGVAVRASTCISSERDKDTWDSLLTTPVTAQELTWGKFVGCLLGHRIGWIWLGLVWGFGVATGALSVFALPIMIAAWWAYAGAAAAIGMSYSIYLRSSMASTVATMLTVALVGAGHWLPWFCCIFGGAMDRSLEDVAQIQVGFTPPAVLFVLPYVGSEFRYDSDFKLVFSACLAGIVAYVVGTAILLSACVFPGMVEKTRRENAFAPTDLLPGSDQPDDFETKVLDADVVDTNVVDADVVDAESIETEESRTNDRSDTNRSDADVL